jgi:hypothetical protein
LTYSVSEVGLAIVAFNVAFIVAFNVLLKVLFGGVQNVLKSLLEKSPSTFVQTTISKGMTALFRRALKVPKNMRK